MSQWWKEAIAYQIYPRSFMDSDGDGIGDLQGIISQLDYLQSLGVTLLWINPIYQSPNDDNGYDISDYQAILSEFGTMSDFDELLTNVHQRGMRLIMDLVINHTSDEHPWFIESRSSKNSDKRNWYIWKDGSSKLPPNNWESIFKGSTWQYDKQTGQYFFHLFSKSQPDLNWQNPQVHHAIFEMINWWLDKGIDGFRLDAITHIKKDPNFSNMVNPKKLQYVNCLKKCMNYDGILDYVDSLFSHTFNRYPNAMTVGEANGVSYKQAPDWVGKDKQRFNMIFSFEHLGLWQNERNKIDVIKLKQTLTRWQKALHDKGWNALFVENHDLPRVISSWKDTPDYWQECATAIAALYFLLEGTPFIYQGQEIGMTNCPFNDIDEFNDISDKNRYQLMLENGVSKNDALAIITNTSRDNARTPMQWNNSANAGFTKGKKTWLKINPNYVDINVEKQKKQTDSILHFYQKLIQLRKNQPVFIHGKYQLLLASHPQIYAYTRQYNQEKVIVITNLSDKTAEYDYKKLVLHYDNLLLSNMKIKKHEALTKIRLNRYETRIYKL